MTEFFERAYLAAFPGCLARSSKDPAKAAAMAKEAAQAACDALAETPKTSTKKK